MSIARYPLKNIVFLYLCTPIGKAMSCFESLKIDLKELADGITTFHVLLDDEFFHIVDGPEVNSGRVDAALSIRKTENYFELISHLTGMVVIPCSRCLDDMEQPIDTTNRLTIKFGDEYAEDDDLVIVPEHEGILDIAWFLYEYIALDIPIQHVHETGKCNVAMIKVLEEHSATRSSDVGENDEIDPRWNELFKLKNKIKS